MRIDSERLAGIYARTAGALAFSIAVQDVSLVDPRYLDYYLDYFELRWKLMSDFVGC